MLIHGKRAAILGRICMDQFMVDVTDIPDVQEDDEVTLLGSDGLNALRWKNWQKSPAVSIMK